MKKLLALLLLVLLAGCGTPDVGTIQNSSGGQSITEVKREVVHAKKFLKESDNFVLIISCDNHVEWHPMAEEDIVVGCP